MPSRSSSWDWVFPAGVIVLFLGFAIWKWFEWMAHDLEVLTGDLVSATACYAALLGVATLLASRSLIVVKFKQWIGVALYGLALVTLYLFSSHVDWLYANSIHLRETPWFAAWWFDSLVVAGGGAMMWFFGWAKADARQRR